MTRPRAFTAFVGDYSVLIAMLLTIAMFAVLRSDQFLTLDNLKVILTASAPLAVVAIGLTVVLVMNDFDLSFGAVAGAAGAIAISLMSTVGIHWIPAVLCTLGAGLVVGLVNGLLTAYVRATAFIVTLAVGTAVTGFEYLITDQKSIYTGIPIAYSNIGQSDLFGFNLQIPIALAVIVAVHLLLAKSESGRRMYAIGGSVEAARLAGIRVARLRLVGFLIASMLAAVAGILLSAESGAYTPAAGAGFLLPAFAAAFLGATVVPGGVFTAIGTAVGVLFLGIVDNGLILLGIAAAWVNIVQGAILVGAIVAARLSSR